jgi:hypothetical protein
VKSLFYAICLSAITAGSALAVELRDGTYNTKYPDVSPARCGVLKISDGGKKIRYEYGPCGLKATWRQSGKFDGTSIRIQHAVFLVTSASNDRISGVWKFRSESTNLTFERQ